MSDPLRMIQGRTKPERPAAGEERSDLELIRGLAAGCEESFRLLFRRWSPRLGPFLNRAVGSKELGEDLLQETFLRALQAAPRFEPRGSVGAWLYRIGANLVYSHWRREQSRPPLASTWQEGLAERLEAAAPDPERLRMLRAFRREAAEALRGLPENQRMVFLLKVEQGLTYEEIGAVLQCPAGTAKSRLHFAVRRLQSQLKQWEPDTLAEGGTPDVL